MATRPTENTAASIWTLRRGVTNPLHTLAAELFVARRGEIYAYLVTLGMRPDEAQEFTSEAFLRYYVALRDGQTIRNPRAWVYTVAHNLAMNRHSEPATLPLPVELPAADRETRESLAMERERMAQLHRAIENLSPQQRHCLHLRADGLRYREIAGIISIDTSTVGELLQRAVKWRRKALYE